MLPLFLLLFGGTNAVGPGIPFPNFYEAVILGRSYQPLVSPFEIDRKPMEIKIGIPFAILVSVDETRQTVSYIAAINMSWHDARLAFDPEDFGYDHIVIRSELIWVPSVETFNSVELKFLDRVATSPQAQVHHTGEVYMWIKGRFDTVCSCDVEAFPFDVQFCNMDFHTGLTPITEEYLVAQNGTELYIGLPEWNMKTAPVITVIEMPVQDGRRFSMAMISFKLDRNPQFYVYFLILPTMTITITCMATLLLPIDIYQGERANLGIAGLLGLTFMLSVIVQEVPRSTKLPLMGKWLMIQMFLCMGAMCWDIPKNLIKTSLMKRFMKGEGRGHVINLILSLTSCLFFVCSDVVLTFILFKTVYRPEEPPPGKIV